jgi:beta-ureidopropionase / N-carbamoyl-L-amino-acid hydrolase
MLVHKLLAQTLFAQIAQATHDGVGITRESYGPGEEQAMIILEKHAARLGLHSSRDALQNLWVSLDASVAVEPSIVIGSHLDSVPQGGNFDGLAGIVAGLLVLLEIKAQGLRTPHPVKLIWARLPHWVCYLLASLLICIATAATACKMQWYAVA